MVTCPFCNGSGKGGVFVSDFGFCRCCGGDGFAESERVRYFAESAPTARRGR